MAISISGTTVIDDQKNLRVDNITANSIIANTSVSLGAIGNVTITGGSSGQAIVTNGSGTLSFGSAGVSTGKAIAMAMIFGF